MKARYFFVSYSTLESDPFGIGFGRCGIEEKTGMINLDKIEEMLSKNKGNKKLTVINVQEFNKKDYDKLFNANP